MKEYEFSVTRMFPEGTFYVEANSYEEAYDKAVTEFIKSLKNVPISIEFELDCLNEDDDEDEE